MKQFFLYGFVALLSLSAGIFWQVSQKADFYTIDGTAHKWRDYQAQWLVINYFAEWCAPCLKEVPELNQFQQSGEYSLFAISFDNEDDNTMQAIAKKYQMQFPIISAESEPELPVAKPRALPTTYIINPNGEVAKTLMGEVTSEKLRQTIAELKRF